jgi:predicted nucleotidyltransferase
MHCASHIPDMVRRMVDRTTPSRVILYGSYARNEADPDSDVDLLVLFDKLENRREVVTALYESVKDINVPKDILIATTSEYERFRTVVNTTFYCISGDGKVLYERPS